MRWLLLACVLTVVVASVVTAYSIARADSTTTVTITATGWAGQCLGPAGLTATKLSDHSVQLTWTKGLGANDTIIRRAFGTCPMDATDGAEVYEGANSSVVDYVDLSTLDTYVCWVAWSVCGTGNYSAGYTEARLIGGVTVMYIALFGLCLGMSWIAFRGKFILWNIAASISWILLWMYVSANPMTGVAEGDAIHTVAMLLPITAAVAVMLYGLMREITVQKDYGEGLNLKTTVGKLKFLGGEEEGAPKRTTAEEKEREIDEYRTKVRGALRNRRYEGRRR